MFVHGGSQTTNAVAEALGHPPQFVDQRDGARPAAAIDRRTLEIFEMVYCGQLNKMWVENCSGRAWNAVGLSVLDGRLFEGRARTRW